MSWDLMAMKFPTDIHDMRELPADWKDTPIGRSAEVADALLTFPGSRVSGQGLVTIERRGYAIEISVGQSDVCSCVMFYVYGDGSAATEVIQKIGERLAVRVFDINGFQFLDSAADPTSGFKHYKAWRDQVLKDTGANGNG